MKYPELKLLYETRIINQEEFFSLALSLDYSTTENLDAKNLDAFPRYDSMVITDKEFLHDLLSKSREYSIKLHSEMINEYRSFLFITCNITFLRTILPFIHSYHPDTKTRVEYVTNEKSHMVNAKIIIYP